MAMKIDSVSYNLLYRATLAKVNVAQKNGEEIKVSDLGTFIDQCAIFFHCIPDDEQRKELINEMQFQIFTKHTRGESIFDTYDGQEDWYDNKDYDNGFFWKRYLNYLANTSMGQSSINLLDEQTLPNILNCLSNPKEEYEGRHLRRGLVIGDVQSGKTATYIGLICKAADAGYKVVILLAGITESLRQQTQERVDEGIVGMTSRKVKGKEETVRVGVGKDGKKICATSYTSSASDFVGKHDLIATTMDQHKSLVLFVVKKNVSVLKRLHNWLKKYNLEEGHDYVNQPMLLIDDEADNASINTKKDETDPTKTNKLIRDICNLFKNANYLGFTATPFANVFIDPDSVDAMNHADLFPENFIYSLPIPATYIGAKDIFPKEGKYHANLHYIADVDEPDYDSQDYKDLASNESDTLNRGPFYYRHKKEWDGILPNSLREAVLCFLMANAVRDLLGHNETPRSMLINMSRFVKVHRVIRDHVADIYDKFVNIVKYDFSGNPEQNRQLPLYCELRSIWAKRFAHISEPTFEKLANKDVLLRAVKGMQIIVVNAGKNAGKLDYKTDKNLRVIAVGGLALSRGLTLEGLMVSYCYRNTATFDVLMQMGRWFGYRRGYENVFQVWTSQQSANWYSEIAVATEELKDNIQMMRDEQLTPKDFGIRVRNYGDELQITATNKMRCAYDQLELLSFYGGVHGTAYVSRNTNHNKNNLHQVLQLVDKIYETGLRLTPTQGKRKEPTSDDVDTARSQYFGNVPKKLVVDFLSHVNCSPVNMLFNVPDILTFINDSRSVGLDSWDVIFVSGKGKTCYEVRGMEKVHCVGRTIMQHNNVVQVSTRRMLLSPSSGKLALSEEDIATVRQKYLELKKKEGASIKGIKDSSIPLNTYFRFLPNRNPALYILFVEPAPAESGKEETTKLAEFRNSLGDEPIICFATGFPGKEDNIQVARYKVNKRYHQQFLEDLETTEDEK